MLGIGFQELLLILVIAIVVVGPKRLPDLAKSLGKGLQEFKKATEGIKSTLGENEALRDLQDIKNSVKDTVSSLKPAGLLDLDAKPFTAQPVQEPKKFETPEVQEPGVVAAQPLLEPKAPVENLEGRIALMDGIASEFHQPEPTPEPVPVDQAAPEGAAAPAEVAAAAEPAPEAVSPPVPEDAQPTGPSPQASPKTNV